MRNPAATPSLPPATERDADDADYKKRSLGGRGPTIGRKIRDCCLVAISLALGSFSNFILWGPGSAVLRCRQETWADPAPGGGGSSDSATADALARDAAERMKRFYKYGRSYQYIPPAWRNDYIPVPAAECGTGPDFDPWWNLTYKDRSRLREDKVIYRTFFKEQGAAAPGFRGTYVELGAYNGREESNTRFFDLCLGWKGLLIEGNPENYQSTVENRRFAHKMSLAPSCSAEFEAVNGTIPFYWYPMANAGLVGHAKTFAGKPTVDVPCGPLAPILGDIFGGGDDDEDGDGGDGDGGNRTLPTVDFFSLDVEGAEFLVLSTIDFRAVRINVLMIEIQNTHCKKNCEVRSQVRARMAEEGYRRYERRVLNSDIYVHPDSPFQVRCDGNTICKSHG